jgi:hypothetical protein
MSKVFSWKQASLPRPGPTDEAVEAGVFGVCADGSLRPSVEEVAAITEEQARELLSTLCDLRHLERCLRRHLNPHTGQPLVSWEIRERIEGSMKAGIANVRGNYEASLVAYADAFGPDAAETLDASIRQLLLLPEFTLPPIEIQRWLFAES